MTINFNDIKSETEWGQFVMSSTTFEIFLKLDSIPTDTVALFTSCYYGGTTIYLRKSGTQINFQIGSYRANSFTDNGGGNYSAATEMDHSGPAPEAGELLHIVGSYNANSNVMKLYINGKLISEANYGDGAYRPGTSGDNFVLGIGYNPQYNADNKEAISKYADYELYEAKIYDSALTDEQVAQEYWNCIDTLLKEVQ